MPKLKTNRASRKRFKFTKNGIVLRASSGTRHIMAKKSQKRKLRLRGTTPLAEADTKEIIKLLPYGRRK